MKSRKNTKKTFGKCFFKKYEKIIDAYAEKYLRLYPHLRKSYLEFKKNKGQNKNDMNIFLIKIMNNFALDHPQEYMKVAGWCSQPEFILPKKDILEILGCKTRDNYFKFLKEKLK